VVRGERGHMVARVGTVAFQGIEAVPVDVQVMVAPGKMGMSIYGLINLSYKREPEPSVLLLKVYPYQRSKETHQLAPVVVGYCRY